MFGTDDLEWRRELYYREDYDAWLSQADAAHEAEIETEEQEHAISAWEGEGGAA